MSSYLVKKARWDAFRRARRPIDPMDDCFVRYGKHEDHCPVCHKDFGKPLPEWDVAVQQLEKRDIETQGGSE